MMTIADSSSGEGIQQHIMLVLLLIFGILGSLFALIKLARETNSSNFRMLLKCLMMNNLAALTGVTIMVILKRFLSMYYIETYSRWFCASWVIFHYFGICSGCIAVCMSVERYLALCHVFFYHVHFTRKLNRNAIIGLSIIGAVITFSPLFGFGLYFDEDTKKCVRFREAKTPSDRAYAILFLGFGTLICIIIVIFNTFVIKALLYDIPLLRNSLNDLNFTCNLLNPTTTTHLEIERKLCKLMLMLNLSFIICWIPDMIAGIFALTNLLPLTHWFFKLADALMALHFTLDPYIYVLKRENLKSFWRILQCWRYCRSSSSNTYEILNNQID